MIQITWVEIVLTGWLTATLVASIAFCVRHHKSVLDGQPVTSTPIWVVESACSETGPCVPLGMDVADWKLGAMEFLQSQGTYGRKNR